MSKPIFVTIFVGVLVLVSVQAMIRAWGPDAPAARPTAAQQHAQVMATLDQIEGDARAGRRSYPAVRVPEPAPAATTANADWMAQFIATGGAERFDVRLQRVYVSPALWYGLKAWEKEDYVRGVSQGVFDGHPVTVIDANSGRELARRGLMGVTLR
jgi:hypothetical protein